MTVDTGSIQPSVTVVIPVRSLEDLGLDRCLASIQDQDYGGGIEAIAVEGGNIPQALNEGIRRARGRYVAFIDSDSVAPREWLSTLISHIEDQEVGGVGGVTRVVEDTLLGKSVSSLFTTYLGSFGSAALYQPKRVREFSTLSTSNCTFTRRLLVEMRGFNEAFDAKADMELSKRVTSAGYKLRLYPEIIVYNESPNSLNELIDKFYRWGRSRTRAMLTNRHLIDPKIILFYLAVLATPLTFLLHKLLPLYLLLIYYQAIAVNAIKKIVEGTELVPGLFMIPLNFIQHLSYFAGLSVGLFEGGYRKKEAAVFRVRLEEYNT
jgi:cellulose synthase/poly-beta-1,6-N-acetylglucosamine synthase-like glycosyltransferase